MDLSVTPFVGTPVTEATATDLPDAPLAMPRQVLERAESHSRIRSFVAGLVMPLAGNPGR